MKKLMIGLCAVALAAGVQASSFTWKASGGYGTEVFYSWKTSAETVDNLYGVAGDVTFYLFDAATISQENLLKGLRNGDAITKYEHVQTAQLNADSTMSATSIPDYGTVGHDYDFYMAALVGDKVLISDLQANRPAQASDPTDVDFGDPIVWSDGDAYDGHPSRYFGDAAFGQAGWYDTAAVPEPTSGLLLLLGVAGLALRRRRA